MSEKKFSKNPDYSTQDSQAEVLIMTSETSIVDARKKDDDQIVNQAQANHKISKKFGSHLDALFAEPPVLEEKEPEPTARPIRSRRKKALPRMGLDALIRNTRMLSAEDITVTDEAKRVTFIYSKNQLEKVRLISKYESIFMKDIIGEAVNQWLERYERKLLKAKL